MNKGRGQNSRGRGGARNDQDFPYDERMMDRRGYRAYQHNTERAFQNDWSAAPPPFEDRPPKPRKPSDRSKKWKKNQQKPKDEEKVDKKVNPFQAKEESKPSDEPMYDLGPHSTGIAVQELYAQNFDHSGFLDIVERTYQQLRGIDPRLDRRMPYSGFLHSMTTTLNAVQIDTCFDNGERKIPHLSGYAQDALPEDLYIPGPIHEYMSNVANTSSQTGEEVRYNLPNAAVPQAPIPGDRRRAAAESGTFGQITPHNHNLYECYVSPYVTSMTVLATANNEPNYQPLPNGFFPNGSHPTENLLGFGPIDVLTAEGRARLQGVVFPNDDSVLGRLRISAELMNRVNSVLAEMKDRFKMVQIGVDESTKRRNYVKHKMVPANLLFCEASNQPFPRLSTSQVTIRGVASFGSAQAGQANIHVLHRRRQEQFPGVCYLTADNQPPELWLEHRNSNFTMVAPFLPTQGVDDPALRITRYISHTPEGVRSTAVDAFIKKNYYIEKR